MEIAAPQELQVRTLVQQAQRVLVRRDTPVLLDALDLQVLLVNRGGVEIQVTLETQVTPEIQALRVLQEIQAILGLRVQRDRRVQQDRLGIQGQRDPPDLLESPVRQEPRDPLGKQVFRDLRVQLDLRVHLDIPVRLDIKDGQGWWDPRDQRVQLDLRDCKVYKECKDHRAEQVGQVGRVQRDQADLCCRHRVP